MDDDKKINQLATFNFIFAGIAAFVLLCLILFMRFVPISNPDFRAEDSQLFTVVIGVLLLPSIAMQILAGVFLRQRKYRVFCIVHAALQCLSFPLGTAIGVYTIVVLNSESVKRKFDPVTYQ